MIESTDPKVTDKPPMRCEECDRVKTHYNVWLGPRNETKVVCWECKAREEKGFFTNRTFRREARSGYIPR